MPNEYAVFGTTYVAVLIAELRGDKTIFTMSALATRFKIVPALIGASGNGKALHASDLVAILPFQLDERSFSVAVYVMTPNIAESMPSLKMTLQVDKKVIGDVSALRPSDQTIGKVEIQKAEDSTIIKFDVHDDVSWIRLKIED